MWSSAVNAKPSLIQALNATFYYFCLLGHRLGVASSVPEDLSKVLDLSTTVDEDSCLLAYPSPIKALTLPSAHEIE